MFRHSLLHINYSCFYFFGSLLGFFCFCLVCCFWTGTLVRHNFLRRQLTQIRSARWLAGGWPLPVPRYFLTSALRHCRFGHLRFHNHLNNSEEDRRAAWKNAFRRSGFEPRSKRLRSSKLHLNQLSYQGGPLHINYLSFFGILISFLSLWLFFCFKTFVFPLKKCSISLWKFSILDPFYFFLFLLWSPRRKKIGWLRLRVGFFWGGGREIFWGAKERSKGPFFCPLLRRPSLEKSSGLRKIFSLISFSILKTGIDSFKYHGDIKTKMHLLTIYVSTRLWGYLGL